MGSLSELERTLNYRFRDVNLLRIALTHPSSGKGSYQRLEFLGDSVLGLVMAEYLYSLLPQAGEGVLTRIKSYLVSTEVLYRVGQSLNLENYILHNLPSVRKAIADCTEALIGAVYLDGGLVEVKKVVERLWAPVMEELTISDIVGPKELLQLYSQSAQRDNPAYEVLEVSGPKHNPEFVVGVFVQGQLLGTGRGNSKKRAESMAAQDALQKIRRRA